MPYGLAGTEYLVIRVFHDQGAVITALYRFRAASWESFPALALAPISSVFELSTPVAGFAIIGDVIAPPSCAPAGLVCIAGATLPSCYSISVLPPAGLWSGCWSDIYIKGPGLRP